MKTNRVHASHPDWDGSTPLAENHYYEGLKRDLLAADAAAGGQFRVFLKNHGNPSFGLKRIRFQITNGARYHEGYWVEIYGLHAIVDMQGRGGYPTPIKIQFQTVQV